MYPSQFANFRAATSTRSSTPMSDDQIRKVAPSVFAEQPHGSRSERYTYLPTAEILVGLRREGFEVFSAMQARTRKEDRREHTKHLVRLRHVGDAGRALDVGDSVAEICVLNSHDGSSSYQMFAGMFRLVCRNGLMVADSTVGSVKVPHTGNVQSKVIEGAHEILEGCTRVVESHETMRSITLNQDERELFAKTALTLRYDEETHAPIKADQLLNPRRMADRASDLWSTFNVVQENIVRGGLDGRNANNKRTSTRKITGIDQDVKVNKLLWMLADGMAKLKTAH